MNTVATKQFLLDDFFIYFPIGVALYDENGELLDINKAVYAKFGIKNKSDFIVTNLFKSDFLDDSQKEHAKQGSLVNGASALAFSLIPSPNIHGRIIGYTMLLTDTTVKDLGTRYNYMTRELQDISEKVRESIPDTILLVNNQLILERIIAYAPETKMNSNLIGSPIDDLPGFDMPEDVQESIRNAGKECLEENKVVNLSLSIPGKRHPIVHFTIRAVPLYNKYAVVYVRNITDLIEKEKENKTLSEKLSQSYVMMELALQHSKIATYTFNFKLFKTCDKVHCNRCFQFHGATSELLLRNKYICRSLTSLRHPDDRHDFFFLFNEIRNKKLAEEKTTFRLKTDEGIFRSYEITGKAQEYDEDGYPYLIIGSIIDNQDRIEYEASLIEAKEKAENADQLKSTFLANMTHEIRSPLHAIVGFSDLLSHETDPTTREDYLNLIKSNNDLLVRLINDILDISKIEANMMSFSYMNVNMPLFMKDIYHTVNLRIPENVLLILDPCPDIVFSTDRSRLSQVLINLLTNAIKHTSQGNICFGYSFTATEIEFYVTDTGKGIPKNKLEQIFSRFVQLKGAKHGIGLGLAICKGLVTKMGGDISVESQEDSGSTFRFWLPLLESEEKSLNGSLAFTP